jgi:hypothetical protein
VISIAAMALGAGALASLLMRLTGSVPGVIAGTALLMLNPNVLYLQSTPMTEPLLFGLSLLAVAATAEWLDSGHASERVWLPPSGGRGCVTASAALAAACLTRYEGWAITGAVVALAIVVLLRRGVPFVASLRAGMRLGAPAAIAIAVFALNSRWVVGEWFTTGGFFVAENVEAMGHPWVAWRQIADGLEQLSGPALVWCGYAGALLLVVVFARDKRRASLVLLLALTAAAALPMSAYLAGHPFRIRYDLPLVVAAAALFAGGVSVLPRLARLPVALIAIGLTVMQASPFDRDAPLIRESQREATAMAGRHAVTGYLREHYDGRTIMMSMGSLGHYMHDLSLAGFDIRQFLHEGNGEIWRFAMLNPSGHAGWILVEENAEGGDALHHAAKRGEWLKGFEPVASGGGASLYRATH